MYKRSNYYLTLFIWSIIYITGTLLAPLSQTRFNLTPAKTHFIQVTFALPVILIWCAAVYGADKFKSYADSIKSDKDGTAFNKIANGLIILVTAVMSGGISGIVRPWALKNGWLEQFTIVFNYLQVILFLLAFYLMYQGSKMLQNALPKKTRKVNWKLVLLIIVPVALIYSEVIFHYAYRNHTPNPIIFSSFYLPDYLLVLTLMLPYLTGWILGLLSAMNILNFNRAVKGVLYRSALHKFVVGIILIIFFAVFLQLLIALSTYFSHIGLSSILFIFYFIVLAYSIGFLVMASGAKKLGAIEKIGVK